MLHSLVLVTVYPPSRRALLLEPLDTLFIYSHQSLGQILP